MGTGRLTCMVGTPQVPACEPHHQRCDQCVLTARRREWRSVRPEDGLLRKIGVISRLVAPPGELDQAQVPWCCEGLRV
jgi:hypothetical protein